MKKMLPLLLLFFYSQLATAQTITARVVDELSNKPLSYAIILYHSGQRVIYTDVNGYFSLATDSLSVNDTIRIEFLGYSNLLVPRSELKNGAVYKMVLEVKSLQPVFVGYCKKFQTFTLNKKTGRIREYIGPGPETKLIIIARYNNISGRNGWLKKLGILINEKTPRTEIPVRLHWYEWDLDNKMPGRELTDTNIIVYPYRKGWNDFDLPEKTIHGAKDWIVFGLEFIYTPELQTQFESLAGDSAKIQWLSDMQNRWSLAMQYVTNENETGFYKVNNGDMFRYEKKYDRYFIRPALRFSIEVCME